MVSFILILDNLVFYSLYMNCFLKVYGLCVENLVFS